jgi:uncharacterized protein
MSTEPLPRWVEPMRLARIGKRLQGRLLLSTMARLAPLIDNPDDEVEIWLEFGVDSQDIPFLRGTAETRLEMQCQRCLQSVRLGVNVPIELGIVSSERAAMSLPEPYDPLIVGSEPIELSAIIEDEFILSLPSVVVHPEGHCSSREVPSAAAFNEHQRERQEHPFAVLAKLKGK